MAKSKKSSSNRQERDIEILQLFGENLRKCREKRKLTQEQLAYEAGFDRSYHTEVTRHPKKTTILNNNEHLKTENASSTIGTFGFARHRDSYRELPFAKPKEPFYQRTGQQEQT